MRCCVILAVLFVATCPAMAQQVHKDVPYGGAGHERNVLDIYVPPNAKNAPVVLWIHGGGWQAGDKSDVQVKPAYFTSKGFVFVSTNYRLLPDHPMETIVADVAEAFHWVHQNAGKYGADGGRVWVMGHSAGAQLAALISTDEKYLGKHGLNLSLIRGCVPVDGDTFDIPAIIETAETRRRVHGLPQARFGHREKFGNSEEKHKDFSAVTHVAAGKHIPPFLILHVGEHPDTTAQAQRLHNTLKAANLDSTTFGARDTTHSRINEQLGEAENPVTKAVDEFMTRTSKE